MVTPKNTARTLLRANRKNRVSWRTISKNGYREEEIIIRPGIKPGTLCRFAKSKGTWLPQDIEILKLLSLHHDKQPKPKTIFEMSSDELLYALKNRQPMKSTHTQAAMQDFIRACKSASKARKATA